MKPLSSYTRPMTEQEAIYWKIAEGIEKERLDSQSAQNSKAKVTSKHNWLFWKCINFDTSFSSLKMKPKSRRWRTNKKILRLWTPKE